MPENNKSNGKNNNNSSNNIDPMRGPGGRGGPPHMQAHEKPKDSGKALRRIVRYFAGNIPALAVIISVSAISAVISIAATRISGSVVDDYIKKHDITGLGIVCIILLAIYLVNVAATYIQARLNVKLSQNITAAIRHDLFASAGKLPLGYFDSHSSGDLMSRLTNDVDTVGTAMSQNVTQLFSGIISIIGTLAAMLLLSPVMTFATVLSVPVMLVITSLVTKYTRKLFKRQSTELGALNGYIEEIVSGGKTVQLFSREEHVKREFAELNGKLKKSGMIANSVSGLMGPLMNMINNCAYLAVAVFGGYMALNSTVTIGDIFSFLQYQRQFSGPINQLANLFNTIQSALAAAERIFEVMDTEPERDSKEAAELGKVNGDIVFDNVTFSYVPGTPVLKNACINAEAGRQIAIVGPTGAGKTTIISLLTRFYDFDSGTILIDGLDVRNITRDSLRLKVGMVLQDTYLFSESVRDNIRYGNPNATDGEVEKAAKMANAHQFIIHLQHGYNTILADNGENLSQGQRQLLAIARAILADPQILILDEATSSVDTRTEVNIQQALLTLMKGRTSFIIAHRLSTIRGADTILVIDNGEIVESGSHSELLEKPGGFYARLYNMQYTAGVAL